MRERVLYSCAITILIQRKNKKIFPCKEFAMSATDKKISEIKHAFSAEEVKVFKYRKAKEKNTLSIGTLAKNFNLIFYLYIYIFTYDFTNVREWIRAKIQ